MPVGNNFQHSQYVRSDPGERVAYLEVPTAAPPESVAWQDTMASYGSELSRAGVRAVMFMHGSYLGTDLFGMQRLDEVGGLKRGYSRGISGLDALLAMMRQEGNGLGTIPGTLAPPLNDEEPVKQLLDSQAQDAANFSTAYVDHFEKAVNRNLPRAITCRRYLWSSEHHHLGRAKAACQLIERLNSISTELNLGSSDRILLEAHGHAGQVAALASNLLAPGGSAIRSTVLSILNAYLTHINADPSALGSLNAVEASLRSGGVFNGASLDVVTFGTPVRYGWDPSGLGKLLHIVNHRMMRLDGKRWLGKMEMPQITMEMPIAWGGDYVQQFAIAGCDAMPAMPEAREANRALWEILEPWDGFERWLECARKSVRCANDGLCLLVDYKDSTGSTNALDHLYGHAAYTRMNNLLFNTGQIVASLYQPTKTS